MIGLCGAHRTGKTTLAREYSQATDIPFVQTSASEVFKAMGFDPKQDYEFKIRMLIQNQILDASEALWRTYSGEFITDRTPIDMLAYTMADIQRENLDKDDEKIFLEYQKRCIEVTNRQFSTLTVIQPGIKLVEAEGKAPANEAYIEHINTLIVGMVNDSRIKCSKFIMSRATTDLTRRMTVVDELLNRVWDRHQEVIQSGAVSLH